MTALYPSREDAELNTRALAVLEKDKKNEADCLMDGAWTGHPDQNQIAVDQFPVPNQLQARPKNPVMHPDLRPVPAGVGKISLPGTRAAEAVQAESSRLAGVVRLRRRSLRFFAASVVSLGAFYGDEGSFGVFVTFGSSDRQFRDTGLSRGLE